MILCVGRMNPDAYKHILVGSIAGGLAGVLVMWNRSRSLRAGENTWRRGVVLVAGTTAFACALSAFSKAFGAQSHVYATMVMIGITGWAAVLNSVAPLPLPGFILKVRAGEFAILRARWTAVRLFGSFLRATPLRHLGGRVYLSEAGRNPLAVLAGVREAQRVHTWALLFCCPWLVFWGMEGMWMSIVWGVAVHVPLNIFPILHLRYVSWRLEACVARMRRSKDAGQNGCTQGRDRDSAALYNKSVVSPKGE